MDARKTIVSTEITISRTNSSTFSDQLKSFVRTSSDALLLYVILLLS